MVRLEMNQHGLITVAKKTKKTKKAPKARSRGKKCTLDLVRACIQSVYGDNAREVFSGDQMPVEENVVSGHDQQMPVEENTAVSGRDETTALSGDETEAYDLVEGGYRQVRRLA